MIASVTETALHYELLLISLVCFKSLILSTKERLEVSAEYVWMPQSHHYGSD